MHWSHKGHRRHSSTNRFIGILAVEEGGSGSIRFVSIITSASDPTQIGAFARRICSTGKINYEAAPNLLGREANSNSAAAFAMRMLGIKACSASALVDDDRHAGGCWSVK